MARMEARRFSSMLERQLRSISNKGELRRGEKSYPVHVAMTIPMDCSILSRIPHSSIAGWSDHFDLDGPRALRFACVCVCVCFPISVVRILVFPSEYSRVSRPTSSQ
jgi:hypothetical protein